jgi:outer membrane protein TolC
VQYNNATRKYAQNQKNVNNQQGNLNLAQSVYEAMQNNYKNGLASLSDLINSDTGLKNAQTQYLTSLLQLKISSLDILYANGTMNQLSN